MTIVTMIILAALAVMAAAHKAALRTQRPKTAVSPSEAPLRIMVPRVRYDATGSL